MIDVSNNNGHINWVAVRRAGHRIAAIKASEGSNHYKGTFYDDRFFRYNMAAAKANGILPCPYYFARPGTSAKAQARHFLELCHSHLGYGAGKLILDIEDADKHSNALVREWVAEFCSILESVIHRLTPIYSYSAFLHIFESEFVHHPLWVANYDEKPGIPPGGIGAWPKNHVYAHQFTDRGECPGIVGHVDISHRFVPLRKFQIRRKITWK